MKKEIVTIGILLIIAVVLIGLVVFYPFTQSEPRYLLLKSGDTINVDGKKADVSYINTSYGDLPVISLNNLSP